MEQDKSGTGRRPDSARGLPIVTSARGKALVPVAIFAVALSVYLAYPTAHFSYDAVGGGILLYQWVALGQVEQLFQRYHVVYLALAAGVEWVLAGVRLEIDPLTLLQLMSTLFAAGSLALYYRLARAVRLDGPLAGALTLLLGGGFGYWYHATNGEPYPLSIFFVLLAFVSLLRAERGPWIRGGLSGAWFGLAVTFHGACVLALPGLAVAAWPRRGDREARLRAVAAIAVAGLVVGAPYALHFALLEGGGSSSEIAADVLAFGGEKGWSIPPPLFEHWLALARSVTPSDWPAVPSSHPGVARGTSVGFLALSLAPLLLLRGFAGRLRRVTLAVAVWFATFFLFFSTYYPGSPKFASYQWAPLLLLVGLALQPWMRRPRLRLAVPAVLVGLGAVTIVSNLDLVRRQADPDSNPHLTRARVIARCTEPGDLVVHLGRGPNQYQSVYTPYFAVRRTLSLDQRLGAATPPTARALEDLFTSALGGSGRIVVLSDVAVRSALSRAFETSHGMPDGMLAEFVAAHRPRMLCGDPAVGSVWMLSGFGEAAAPTPSSDEESR